MNNLSEYLIQSIIGLTLFYIVYVGFLRKQTFFAVNRFFLTGSVFFSLIIPLIDFSGSVPVLASNFGIVLDTIQINGSYINESIRQNPLTSEIFFVIYFTGASLFGLRFLFQISQLLLLIKKYGITRSDGINYVFTDKNYSPFSFFNLIFLSSNNKSESGLEKIIVHEQIHIKQYHSADLILIELLTIIHWFNPLIWFYRYSLKEVHEFLADEGVLLKGFDEKKYQNLLLSQALGIQVNDLSNNFNQSLIKKRLIMMKTTKSGKWAKFRILLSIPVVSYAMLAFSGPVPNNFSVNNEIALNESKQITHQKTPQKKDSVFQLVEEMPIFTQGGKKGIREYIAKNVQFPKKSRKEGVQAKVYISFVVNKKGNVQNVKIARIEAEKPNKKGKMVSCEAPEIEAEALRVIKSLPSFTPGKNKGIPVKVAYTVPINFKLN